MLLPIQINNTATKKHLKKFHINFAMIKRGILGGTRSVPRLALLQRQRER